MTAHQVLLFDLDGTLTDPKSGITKSIQYALAQFGIDETDLATLTSFIGPPLTESFQKYYGFDAVQAEQALLFYREYFTNGGMYDNAVYPGIINLLTALTAQEKRLLVATSKPTVFAEQILAHFQLDTYFEQIIGSNLDGTRTTKTEIIAYTLATVPTIARSATIMIGDRKHDICGARDNGLPSIAVGYGYGTLDELVAATPTYLVPTVEQLAKLLQGE
jgi:phosphoglycolate phosphatase